jgi:hypothetical protein
MNWLVISKPASILSLSKIGARAFAVLLVSRLIPAAAFSPVCPVNCCWAALLVIVTAPPLMALRVVELASPDALSATGGATDRPPLPGRVCPGPG